MQSFEIRELTPGFGVEIVGLDLAQPVSDAEFARIRDAWFDRSVMVVRDQHIEPEHQIAFANRFGPPAYHVLDQFLLPGHRELLILSNERKPDGSPAGFEDAGRYWHSDLAYEELPALASMLYAIEIPPEGGDTLFADMVRAWQTLPDDLKRRVEGRRAFNSYTATHKRNQTREGSRPDLSAAQMARVPGASHPIVRTVEDTGRKALFVSPGFTVAIEGMAKEESDALLAQLFEHATRPDNIYTHKWRPHDILCWDNRSSMHHATLYDPKFIRHMHRSTITGTRPV